MLNLSKIRYSLGHWLSKTRLGVFIITYSYVHKNYEWYRQLIFESDYTLDEIRELMKKGDKNDNRAKWLIIRSRYAGMHCTYNELKELLTYLED